MIPDNEHGIYLAGRKLYERGLVSGTEGNISVKQDNESSGYNLICTPTGTRLDSLNERELSVINDGELLSGPPVTSEFPMHRLIQQHEHVRAVIHTHAPYSTALSLITKQNLASLLTESEVLYPVVPRVPRLPPGSDQLAEAVSAQVSPETPILILEHHGILAVGASLEEALNFAEMYENFAKIMIHSKAFEP